MLCAMKKPLGMVAGLVLALSSHALAGDAARSDGLLTRWKLHGDARDGSGAGLHGEAIGVDFTAEGPSGKAGTAARFDGVDDVIRVPGGGALRFGTREFTVTAWIHTERELGDVVGDIASKLDLKARRGWTLGVVTNAAAASAQANYRQLQFGIDDGRDEPRWIDRGRPGNALYVFALAVHDGRLYAGTCEPGADEAGHVYRFDGGPRWTDLGRLDGANAVTSLASFDGTLFAATGRYRLRGSSLSDSPNQTLGGRVFRREAEGPWIDCGRIGESEAVNSLAIHRGRLHASSLYSPGVFRYEGGARWTDCGTPNGRRVEALATFNGWLYGGGYDAGEIYRYKPEAGWQVAGTLPETTQTYGFAVHAGRLHVGTWPSGSVYREDPGEASGGETSPGRWTSCGRLGQEKEVMGMAVYNGKLYAGTLPLAEVYRHDGDGQWTRTGQLDSTPNVTYRRAWSMAVFDGKLFCGTLPSGHVFSLEAGKCATYDAELAPG